MMGSFCCCFGSGNTDGNEDENGSNQQKCLCFNCCFESMLNKYQALFHRDSPLHTSNQEAVPSDSEIAHNNSSDATGSCDRTLPSDQNSGHMQLAGYVVVARGQDRGSSHSRVQPEPFSEVEVEPILKLVKMEERLVNACKQEESKACCSKSSLAVLSSGVLNGVEYFVPSFDEDEDICPTCLDDYTEENPKMWTHCSHHYHLSCIYEWMERSETCPVCGRLNHQCCMAYMKIKDWISDA